MQFWVRTKFSVLFWTILLTSGHNLKLNRVGQRGILKSVFYHYSIRLAIFKFYIVKFKHCDRGCQISCPTHGGLIWRPCWGKTTWVDGYQLCFQEARTLPNTKHNLEKIILQISWIVVPPKWHSLTNRDVYEPLWSRDHTWINCSMNGHDKAKVIIERGWGVGDVWLWPIRFQFPLVPPFKTLWLPLKERVKNRRPPLNPDDK